MQNPGLPKEPTKVLPATGGPEEDPVVSSQSGRHDVAFRLAAGISLPVVDHSETGCGKKNSRPKLSAGVASDGEMLFNARTQFSGHTWTHFMKKHMPETTGFPGYHVFLTYIKTMSNMFCMLFFCLFVLMIRWRRRSSQTLILV